MAIETKRYLCCFEISRTASEIVQRVQIHLSFGGGGGGDVRGKSDVEPEK
jgi:hypothetical protein